MTDSHLEFEVFARKYERHPGVIITELFGCPCLKSNHKAFLVQQNHCLVFKLPPAQIQFALSLFGASIWDPMQDNSPMDGWVALPLSEYRAYQTLACAAFELVHEVPQLRLVTS